MKHKIKNTKVYILFICFFLILLIQGINNRIAAANNNYNAVVINDGINEYDLTNSLQILQDTTKELTVDSIFDTEVANKFLSYKESNLSGQISSYPYWAKVTVLNNENHSVNMLLEINKPHLNNVQFFIFNGKNFVKKVDTGIDYPFSKREISNKNFVFNINLPPKTSQTIVLRVEAKSYLQLPIKLCTNQQFIEKEEYNNIILGLYYGIMVIMLLYNFILYFSLKDTAYIYYCSFIFAFSIMQFIWDGLAFQYLWPNLVFWNSKSNPFFIILSGITSLLFTRNFLQVASRNKSFSRFIIYFLALEVLGLVTVIIVPVATATKLSVLIISISISLCLLSVRFIGFKDRAVKLYTISWVALFLGSLLNILAAYKIIPLNFITLYSPRIGAIVNAVLLSLSLGDRFILMRNEKIIAESQKVLLENLHIISKTITSTNNIDTMMAFLLQNICKITKFENGMIMLKEDENYIVKAAQGYKSDEVKNKTLKNLGQDLYFTKIIDKDGPVVLDTIDMSAYGINSSFKSLIGFPISYHDNNVGIILLFSSKIEPPSKIQNEILYDFTGQIAIAVENARLFNKVKEMATIDGLTEVYNRTYFFKLFDASIEEYINTNKNISLIMLDIDNFKKINDTYGHIAGDKVLQQLVQSIKAEVNSDSLIGRYGGEEFLILLKETDLQTSLDIAERLRTKVESMKLTLDDDSCVKYTISIGVISTRKYTLKTTELIEKVDQALYISKQNGKNQVSTIYNIE